MIFVRMKKGDNSPHFTNNIKSLNLQKLQTSIDNSETNIFLKGLHGSSKSFLINSLFTNSNKNIYWVLENKESAGYHFNDLETNHANLKLILIFMIFLYNNIYINLYVLKNNSNFFIYFSLH